ncbi:hypothetical protein GMLC_22930 [Geomonas limicola]|uniref:Uncharacterized protein n=1 Tax=Geomonas limicola TaxID=2740186 RepID=A0A6V8N9Z5_9BACT|nr:hypothetical protein [Geomonas limicola]GFO68714.1 hypothetical protein GMLC_22930 [Geomonas limicola]
MTLFDRITQKLQEKINNPALAELMKEQKLQDLFTKREFRITQAYLQREFLSRAQDDELVELSIELCNGYGEVSGKMKKRLLPAIPFSATFTIQGMEFSPARKYVLLKLEQVAPLDIEWLTRKVVEHIPFLTCSGDLVTCDLNRVPRLAELFARRVRLGSRELNGWDLITLKELTLKQGEIVGRVGVVL